MSTVTDSPILSVPPEITATIFGHCLPALSSPSLHEAPMLLTRICHQWREISLDTPALWASLAFGERRSIELLKEWLSRARNHPLTISLECSDERKATTFMNVLKPYCPQWKDVYFTLPMSAHRQLKTSTFPNLQKLSLSAPYHEPEPTTDPVIILDAPLLREATVSNIAYLQVHLPLGQLAVLSITFMDIPQIIALLRCCPNLLDLSCRFIAVDEDELPLLELRSLRSLNIPNEYILPCLTLPCLERLQIVRIDGEIDAATDVLQSLVSRSSCTLQFFSVRGLTDGTAAELQHFLRAANTITHLKLSFTRFVPLQFQIQALQGDDVLPRLTHLEIHDTGEGDGYRLLADVLLWRRTHAALEMCELFLGSDISTAVVIAEVGALGEAGLRVRITTRVRGSKGDVTLLDTHPA